MLKTAFQILDAPRDENLGQYFIVTPTIKSLADAQSTRVLAVGLRGIGKSAAFRYLVEYDQSVKLTVGLDRHRHKMALPLTNVNYATSEDQFYLDLVMEALRLIVDNAERLPARPSSSRVKKAKSLINKYRRTVKENGGTIRASSLIGSGFTVTKPNPQVLIAVEHKLDGSDELLKEICEAGLSLRIVVDDPEAVLSASKVLDVDLVGGFCLAALRFSQLSQNLKVICLLRTNIYHELRSKIGDFTKYPDYVTRLSWTQDGLRELVEKRVAWATVKRRPDLRDLFETRAKSPVKILDRMVKAVRNGPRDLLRWIYLGLQNAAEDGRAKIRQGDISASRSRVAIASLDELETAYGSKYEEITHVIRAIFRKRSRQKIPVGHFITLVDDLAVSDLTMRKLQRLPWMQQTSSAKLPVILFEVGAIGFEARKRSYQPYEVGYDLPNFEIADNLYLAPLLAEAVE